MLSDLTQIVTAGKMCAVNVLMVKNRPSQELNIWSPTNNGRKQKYHLIQKMQKQNKTCIITNNCQVGEMVEKFQEAFAQVKEHQNAKLVLAVEFQTDTNHLKK